jgi:hypothetical protein
VVAGHDEVRRRQRLEEAAGGLELARAGALGQVAGDDDELGLDVPQPGQQAVDERGLVGAEVDVRDVRKNNGVRQRCVRRRPTPG